MRIAGKVIFFVLIVFISGCCMYPVRYDGPYCGKVVDEVTGEPIEGVVVLGVWYKVYPSPAGSTSKYYDAYETVTDRNGEFYIPGLGLRFFTFIWPMDILIFKAGYSYEEGPWESFKLEETYYRKKYKWEDNKLIIPLKKLTIEERKKQLGPPDPPSEAPLEKVIIMLKEIDKDNLERGFDRRGMWGGKKY
jgi:hypothetical protein